MPEPSVGAAIRHVCTKPPELHKAVISQNMTEPWLLPARAGPSTSPNIRNQRDADSLTERSAQQLVKAGGLRAVHAGALMTARLVAYRAADDSGYRVSAARWHSSVERSLRPARWHVAGPVYRVGVRCRW